MADVNYNSGLLGIVNQSIDLNAVTVRAILLTEAGVTAMQDKALASRDDITGEIGSATNYTAGGTGILISTAGGGLDITKDDVNDRVEVTFDPATIAGTTITAYGIIYFVSRGGAASADELLSLNDFGGAITSTAAAFNLAAHVMRLQN
jgi:hypothetical protein